MNILAIDTSTDWCGIALVQNGECRYKIEEQIPRKHAEKLPRFYELLKDQTNLDEINLNALAVSIGPGSFTGLRVGLGFTKGLAFAKELPIIPVPTLQIIAANSGLIIDKFTVMMYSHRDIIYYQRFTFSNNQYKPINEEKVGSWNSIQHTESAVHCGCEKLVVNQTYPSVHPSAEMAGLLAEKNFNEWVLENPYTLEPNYISPFELGPIK